VRRNWWVAAVLAGAVLVALITGRPATAQPAYDPNSTASNGTKALVLLLQRLGDQVTIGPVVPAGAGPALVLVDNLNGGDRTALLRWVSAGHTLVVADPSSALAGVEADSSSVDQFLFSDEQAPLRPYCALPVGPVTEIQPGGGTLLAPSPGQVGCFRAGGGDFLVARPQGAGTVVVLGAPDLWTNANLSQADNSVLAAGLLAPGPGTTVTVVGSSRVGGGQTGLLGLISPKLKEWFWQLVIAFGLVAAWRARRLGRPVQEVLPVVLPGSELVVATGRLYQEAGHAPRAAQILRADLARTLTATAGLGRDARPEEVAAAVAGRTGLDEDVLLDALAGPPPAGDTELVVLAQQIEAIRLALYETRGGLTRA
jgi:hypothetical protein